jgi:hypothetical protein
MAQKSLVPSYARERAPILIEAEFCMDVLLVAPCVEPDPSIQFHETLIKCPTCGHWIPVGTWPKLFRRILKEDQ